ncbi:MAG: DUF6489 family protein [Sphingomonadaceae bacterium]
MKIEVEIEATPVEARQFLGLPDLTPLHDMWLQKMQEMMTQGVSAADMERLMKTWTAGVPGLSENLERWQQLFWSASGLGGKPEDKS